MRVLSKLSLLGFVSFTAVLFWGFYVAEFWQESDEILQWTWGKIMLLDLYIGLIIFSVFIFYIEDSFFKPMFWSIFLLIGGNGIALLYLFLKRREIELKMVKRHI